MPTPRRGRISGWLLSVSAMNKTGPDRIWEIDFFRGIALILMILFHLFFDLKEFYGYNVPYDSGLYYYTGKVSVILFILISAVSSSLSRNNVRRGVKYLGVGMLITVVTHLYNPEFGIKFGILHFLGTCILLYPLFRNFNKYILLFLGTLIIALGQILGGIAVKQNYLFLFNLTNGSWISADYYPLFPWLGVFLYGIVLGKILYPRGAGLFRFRPSPDVLGFIGRHTLAVYLVHQPVLILAIGAFQRLTGR